VRDHYVVGIDLELADCAAARYQLRRCRESGPVCVHDPDCDGLLSHLLELAAADRPEVATYPSEFEYRRFSDVNAWMLRAGMGFEAEIMPYPSSPEVNDGPDRIDEETDLAWRSQICPGRTGIPAFKLRSNDRWLVTVQEIDGALAAYQKAPADLRVELETEPKWVAWLAWLAVARHHGGFEAE
jgi:hypothetical protein